MTKARTWSVRLSVDDLNASFCLLESDQEVASWVRGLMRGLNAGECKESASPSYLEGWEIGRDSRARADEIRLGCAETGRIGGTKRVANAQANAQANASPDASPNGQPVAQPERRTKNEELGTKNEERGARSEPARGIHPADHSDLIPGKLRSMEFANAWQSWMAYQEEKGFPVQRTQAKFALLSLSDNPGDGHIAATWIADSIKQGRRAIEKPREAPRSSDQGAGQVPAWKAERNAKLDGQIRRLIGQKAQNAHRPQTCKEIDREIEDLERQKSQ